MSSPSSDPNMTLAQLQRPDQSSISSPSSKGPAQPRELNAELTDTLYLAAVVNPGDEAQINHYNSVVGASKLLDAIRERKGEDEDGKLRPAVMSRKDNREWYPKQPGPLLVLGEETKKDKEKFSERLETSEVSGAEVEGPVRINRV
ncbi:hypothetical protein TrRE_jg11309 [Triparma retinervis]|uniref:Uncharacterized protein n=1 Tax=Triparma retinervis TaxID=2557542 RepID=A0A9W7DZQ6_9STRA|nr:hypothetical protein TrRE_jg11309 [Triparma retinervis]